MRKAEYRLIYELTNNTDSEAQVFGKSIHKALEHWYCLPEENRQLTDIESKQAEALIGGLAPEGVYPTAFDSLHEFIKAGESLRWLGDDDKRSLQNGIKILKAYFKHYANDGMEVYRDSAGFPYVEKQVEGLLHEDSKMIIFFHGQIDLILRNKISGELFVADHKTTASLGKDFFNRLAPNHQYTGYVWASREFLGLDTNSFLVNGIQVAKTKCEFARQTTIRGYEDFEEMKMAYVEASQRLIAAIESGNYPQTSPGACASYGGCMYLDCCSAPMVLRKNILEGKFGKA